MIMRISMPNRFRLKKVMGFRTMIRPERGEIHYICLLYTSDAADEL